jgi:coproporphyrinogen III oxidase-like Fe-S oxidoreductase
VDGGHDENQAERAIDIAQQAANWSINIDLLSGLVGETDAHLAKKC